MFCKNCGQQLDDNAKFCINCGIKVSNDEDATAEILNESPESIDSADFLDLNEESSNHTTSNNVDSYVTTNSSNQRLNDILGTVLKYSTKVAISGIALFLAIVIISLVGWGRVYLFGGYDFTSVLTTISMILMLSGLVVSVAIVAIGLFSKYIFIENYKENRYKIIAIVVLILCLGLSIWGFIDYDDNNSYKGGSSGSSSGGSYGGSYNDIYNSGVDKSIGLSLKVDNIKTSSSYTYVYCTVTNVSSKYVATRYRYVKVKGVFKDYSGKIVDTDWTYAVDSTWLEPGESKTFYFMVKNTSIKNATLSFVD